ncbi:beta-1 adrenergic receptor-like [Orbicella faveolata]|uniref:beta-1 adrenergic receptor-like n=1 Tax=Orbicella faveolata TaxID=48498 RepID=UPI0009E600CD|nr:beta-1 adrenergic receptor-like [Orbicella faveolata]
MIFNSWNLFWSVCFAVTAVIIIISNSLSIAVLRKQKLRKRCHYLLIDLAIADLLVGIFAIPIFMITVIPEDRLVSTLVLDCVDMFTGFCSIFTLAVISLERLNAIARPLQHRTLSSRDYTVAIVTPWILSLIPTTGRVLLGSFVITIRSFVIVIIISLSTPLLITCTAYCVIWRKQACRVQDGVGTMGREARLSKTLFLITGTFVLTWLPFEVLVSVFHLCSPCTKEIPYVVLVVIKLLHFSNSFINFIIYCLRIPDYREAVSETFFRCKCRHVMPCQVNIIMSKFRIFEIVLFQIDI